MGSRGVLQAFQFFLSSVIRLRPGIYFVGEGGGRNYRNQVVLRGVRPKQLTASPWNDRGIKTCLAEQTSGLGLREIYSPPPCVGR